MCRLFNIDIICRNKIIREHRRKFNVRLILKSAPLKFTYSAISDFFGFGFLYPDNWSSYDTGTF